MRCCPSAAACTSRGCCNDPLHQPRPNANPDPDRGGTGAPAHADARGTRRLAGRRWARLLAYLGVLGPGLIASQAGNDAGGIATYSSAGSQFGYRMLFFMLLVAIGLVLVQEMAARLGTFTGKGLAALIREEFSLRVATFALGCLLLGVAIIGTTISPYMQLYQAAAVADKGITPE